MWQLFGAEIIRFSILVAAALVLFGMFWLYYDAWTERKAAKTIPLLLGLLCLSGSFLAQALSLETHLLATAWSGWVLVIAQRGYLYLRLLAYLFILVGLLLTPLTDRPKL
jgi:hypothetical protein